MLVGKPLLVKTTATQFSARKSLIVVFFSVATQGKK